MATKMHYNTRPSIESHNQLPLADHVRTVMDNYFKNLSNNDVTPEKIYELVMSEVELPLIEAAMEYTGNNQSDTAKLLGVNRGTFRKKLLYYGLIS